MKRLRPILTAVCLLLSLATAALWIRSAGQSDRVDYQHTALTAADASAIVRRWGGVVSYRGRIQLAGGRADYNGFNPGEFAGAALADGWSYNHGPYFGRRPRPIEGELGFGVDTGIWSSTPNPAGSHRATYTVLQFPHWFLVLLLAVPAAFAAVRRLRRRRRDPNARPCPACGYDLRASPTRCPECGHTAAAGGRLSPAAEPPAIRGG